MLDLRALAFFKLVADTGSISEASRAERLSQPAGSRLLLSVERSVNVRLFRRTSRGMVLTPAGERFRAMATDILIRAQRAEAAMRAAAAEPPPISVACPDTTAALAVAPFVAETGAAIIDIRACRPAEVYHELVEGVDFAIGTMPPPGQYASTKITDIPIKVQRPASDAVAAITPGTIELETLQGERLLIPGYGSAVERELRRVAAREAIELDWSRLTSNGTIAQALSAAGHGVAVVTEPTQFLLSSMPVTVVGEPLTIPLFAAWEKDHYAAAHIRELIKSLVQWMQGRFA